MFRWPFDKRSPKDKRHEDKVKENERKTRLMMVGFEDSLSVYGARVK